MSFYGFFVALFFVKEGSGFIEFVKEIPTWVIILLMCSTGIGSVFLIK